MIKSVKTKTIRTPFENFTQAMDALMRVPHAEIKKALEQERIEKAEKKQANDPPAPSEPSDHASCNED
jgi:hypothetical protein